MAVILPKIAPKPYTKTGGSAICREWAKRGSMSFPFTSMTGGVSLTTNYAGNASMGAGRASGRLWLTAPVIYPNEQRKRRNTPNEFWIYDDRHTIAASYPFVDLPSGDTLRCKLFQADKFYKISLYFDGRIKYNEVNSKAEVDCEKFYIARRK